MNTRSLHQIRLPPKRFEPGDDPVYDEIRPRSWFGRLLKRKWQIPFLREAWRCVRYDGFNQKLASFLHGVDERELRDYSAFVDGKGMAIEPVSQEVLDDAYHNYCEDGAKLNIRAYISSSAALFGVNPRPVIELWEVHPLFYPSGYKKDK